MPNRNSNAGHIPQRTCVVCRTKAGLPDMLSFVIVQGGVVFDIDRRLQTRKFHLCHAESCLDGLAKWKQKRLRKNSTKRAQGDSHAKR